MCVWMLCVWLLIEGAQGVTTPGSRGRPPPPGHSTNLDPNSVHPQTNDTTQDTLGAPSGEYDNSSVIRENASYDPGAGESVPRMLEGIGIKQQKGYQSRPQNTEHSIVKDKDSYQNSTKASRSNGKLPVRTSSQFRKYYSDEDTSRKDKSPDDYLERMQADFGDPMGGKGKTAGVAGRGKANKKKKNRNRVARIDRMDGNYSNEYRIKMKLSAYYDKTTRPVRNDSTTTDLYIGMSLYHILDTNEKYQTLSALIAIRLRWIDEYMNWDPQEYGGLTSIWVPAMRIWTPDIFINNFADDSFRDFMDTYAIVQHTGEVLWMFPAVVKTYCTLDVRHFPFDQQKCDIVFISWTFHGFKLNVTYNETENNAIYYKPKNQEWYVDQVTVARHEQIYACCVEPYPDVTFTIHMTRRSLFYIINLIFPCLLIYAVSFLGFFLPVESGEKVNLEITILLALVVFLLIVGETLPPTPDAIPALGLLFGLTMMMVSIALVMAVIVTNIFLRKESSERVPGILRQVFLRSISRRNSLTNKITMADNHITENNRHGPHLDLELDNLSILSEVETLTCKNRNHRRKSALSRSPAPHNHIGGDYHEDPNDTLARHAEEWQLLARVVDRIFFWLFLLASIGALTAVFAQVPTFRAT